MTRQKKSFTLRCTALLLALIMIVGSFAGCKSSEEPESTAPSTEATTVPTTVSPYTTGEFNPLTGELNYDKALLKNRTVMVSVENSPQARPQWGISSADIVWEMVVEGGITRMLLMFADASRLPDKIGPTRSARHYFVELAEGFDSIFVHFGGSPQAYSAIRKQGTDDIDGMYLGNTFSRDTARKVSSEHRAYTTKDKVVDAIANKKYRTEVEEGKEKPFSFSPTAYTLPDGVCTELTVPFSNSYTYKYTYDTEKKVYLSSLGGKAFMDDNGTQQNFTNIIVCYVDVGSISGDSKGRVTFDLSDGKGVFISNGSYQNITWEKGGYTDIMKFYVADDSSDDADKKEIALNVGRTYIALVPSSRQSLTEIK